MTLVAGVDYSSKAIDVVLLDESSEMATWHHFPLTGHDAFERVRDVHRAFNFPSGIWDNLLAVGIEDPRGYGAGSLYRVQGAILAEIPWSVLVQPWIPGAWRKAVGLPGNATKDAITYFAKERRIEHGASLFEQWPQDAYDAYCIALATRSLIQVEDAA